MAIGSGGNFALAAARALADSDLDAEAIVRRSLAIAAEICVYTNANVVIETLDAALSALTATASGPSSPADLPMLGAWLERPHVAGMVGRRRTTSSPRSAKR